MPKFLHAKLAKEYSDPSVPFKIMDKMGAMHGNKETKKGAAMQKKHDQNVISLKSMKHV